jgi:serine protease Do/serine protease DegQ
MGVSIQPVTEEFAQSFGLRQAKGALVSGVMAGSPADRGGVRQEDIIIAFNGVEVKDPAHLQRLVAEAGIGRPIKVTVFRDGRNLDLTMTLVSADSAPQARRGAGGERRQLQGDPLGLVVEDTEGGGVVVADLIRGGAAADVGIQRGDLIVAINRRRIANAADYQKIVRQAQGRTLIILVRRGDASIYFALKGR